MNDLENNMHTYPFPVETFIMVRPGPHIVMFKVNGSRTPWAYAEVSQYTIIN